MSAVSVASRQLDEARAFGGSAYYPHTLSCVGDDSDFAMRLRSLTVGPLMAGVLSYDVEVHIETTRELATAYEVNVPLAGALDCWVGGRHAVADPNRAVVNGPSHRSTLHGFGRGRPLFGLKVQRTALEGQYAALHGHPPRGPVELRPSIALDRDEGRRWWSLTRTLLDAVHDPDGPLGTPMVAHPLVDAILRGLLVVAGDPVESGPEVACPAAVRTATEFLREHAREPLTVSEIAAAGGCCVRALQEGFRRHLGTTPMTYLQQVRLAGAHADLLDGDPVHESVNDVCWRWGFTHAGRFAATYRRRYGVLPSESLRG